MRTSGAFPPARRANDRGDNFFSVAYWYQSERYTDFPPLPPVAERIPRVKAG
jgi:hypothetical protein